MKHLLKILYPPPLLFGDVILNTFFLSPKCRIFAVKIADHHTKNLHHQNAVIKTILLSFGFRDHHIQILRLELLQAVANKSGWTLGQAQVHIWKTYLLFFFFQPNESWLPRGVWPIVLKSFPKKRIWGRPNADIPAKGWRGSAIYWQCVICMSSTQIGKTVFMIFITKWNKALKRSVLGVRENNSEL